eukprot:3983177-Prymnesium_polylepis.2
MHLADRGKDLVECRRPDSRLASNAATIASTAEAAARADARLEDSCARFAGAVGEQLSRDRACRTAHAATFMRGERYELEPGTAAHTVPQRRQFVRPRLKDDHCEAILFGLDGLGRLMGQPNDQHHLADAGRGVSADAGVATCRGKDAGIIRCACSGCPACCVPSIAGADGRAVLAVRSESLDPVLVERTGCTVVEGSCGCPRCSSDGSPRIGTRRSFSGIQHTMSSHGPAVSGPPMLAVSGASEARYACSGVLGRGNSRHCPITSKHRKPSEGSSRSNFKSSEK